MVKAADVFLKSRAKRTLALWRGLLSVKGAPDAFALKLGKARRRGTRPKPVLTAGVRAAREAGKPAAKLLAALTPLAGRRCDTPRDSRRLAASAKTDGDPARRTHLPPREPPLA